jgi:hypothetical protein
MSLKGCIDMKVNPHSYHTILTDLLEFAYIYICMHIYIYIRLKIKPNSVRIRI